MSVYLFIKICKVTFNGLNGGYSFYPFAKLQIISILQNDFISFQIVVSVSITNFKHLILCRNVKI